MEITNKIQSHISALRSAQKNFYSQEQYFLFNNSLTYLWHKKIKERLAFIGTEGLIKKFSFIDIELDIDQSYIASILTQG